jgi:hypothetical protein
MTTKWNEGDRLKFITTFGDEIIGKVFVHEPETNTLVIQEASFKSKRNFRVINAQYIDRTAPAPEEQNELHRREEDLIKVGQLNLKLLRQREDEALAKAQQSVNKLGQGVSAIAQIVFNELDKILPCRWEGQSIVVMNAVRVESPYTVDACVAVTSTGQRSLAQVQKVVEGARKKIEKQNPELLK